MSETALKFGPEWLRVLSHGATASSPPSSPGPAKFKLADYRYGREEMLALFSKEFPPPDGLQSLGSLCIEHMQEPLAYLPMTSDEQRMWQRCVYSDGTPRTSGRAPVNGAGRGRGGSVDRGRGRGRGVGSSFYSRGTSYDEETEARVSREAGPPGLPVRAKGFERSQSVTDSRGWVGERVAAERTPGAVGGEERGGAVSPRKEQGRAAVENWRSRGAFDEEGSDRWSALTNSREKWGGRGAWRGRDNGVETEWEDGRGATNGVGLSRNTRSHWENERDNEGHRRQWEDDNLPEWATENADDKGGSFDATGNFHAPGSSDDEELKGSPLEKAPPREEKSQRHHREKESLRQEENYIASNEETEWFEECDFQDINEEPCEKEQKEIELNQLEESEGPPGVHRSSPLVNGLMSDEESSSSSQSPLQINDTLNKSSSSAPPHLEKMLLVEDDKLEHMQSVADDLVAKLVEDDEPRPHKDATMHHRPPPPPPGGFIPADPVPLQEEQWYYTDPQGDIQGPFSSADMAAWCKAGYFKPDLLLRRHCDDKFAQLGDLTRVFGRLPFLPGPPMPPLKVSELLNAQKAERERYELMQTYQLQKQLYQQQTTLRQQQVLQQLQNMDEWSSLSPVQQQQLFVQHMLSLPPLVQPVLPPASLHSASTTVAVTTSSNQPPPSSADLRSSLSSASPQHDPIQAFVAQMSVTPSSIPVGVASELPAPHPTTANPGPVSSESPLQKLLLQLQRGSQSAVGSNLTSSSTSAAVTGHPSTVGPVPTPLGLDNSSEQFDAIQSLMSQLSKLQLQNTDNLQHDELRQKEEDQKRIEEERKRFEDQKRAEEERMKLQEIRLQEERAKEEERRKELEEKNQRLEEELRRIQEEQNRLRRDDDSRQKLEEKRKQQDSHQKLEQQQKKEEEVKRARKQKQEEEQRKREEARRAEEERRQEEEKRRKAEEEKRKQEEEKKKKEEKERQQQVQIQEEMRRLALEEERRRMQQMEDEERKKAAQEEQNRRHQQLLQQQKYAAAALQEKIKQMTPAWNSIETTEEEASAPSLAEIQKAQEVNERKDREAEAQRESQRQKEAQRIVAEEKRQKEANMKWAARVSQSAKSGAKAVSGQPPQPPVTSLLEIQKEEEKELKKRQEKEQAERAAAVSHLSLNAAGVWGSAAQSLSWANRASSHVTPNVPPLNPQGSQQAWGSSNTMAWSVVAQSSVDKTNPTWSSDAALWNQSVSQSSGGFWESPDAVKAPSKSSGPNASRSPKVNTGQQGSNKNASSQAVNSNNKVNKKKGKDECENVKKLFTDSISPADNFAQWCKGSLHSMKVHASIDIPTFVIFLADVESPYEVHDYIRSYLGDSKEVKEFAKQYLERRSKARNAQKEEQEDDNILAPAPAVNPSSTLEFQEVKTRLKKGKKKMQKVDNSILGFSVSSLDRVDVEEDN